MASIRRTTGERAFDTTRGTVGSPAPVILPDTGVLFARRAERLEGLAKVHPMADWWRFMARLAGAQHKAARILPDAPSVPLIEGDPPLSQATHQLERYWQDSLPVILDVAYNANLPDQARAAIRSLRARVD